MAVSTALLYTFIVVMVAIIALSIIGNLLVILAVFLCPSLRKRGNIPLASLSVSDLLFTALHPPMWIVALLNPEFRLPWGLCVLQSYITPVLWGVSLCHIGCIAVHRFFRILYRYRFPAMISTKAVCIKVALAWLMPFLSLIFIHLNPARDVKYHDKIKHCAVMQTSSTLAKAIAGLPIICPYFVALACYIIIWLVLRKSKKTMLEQDRRKAAAQKIRMKTLRSSDSQGGSTSHKSGSSGRGTMSGTPTPSATKDDTDNLPGVPVRKSASAKMGIKSSSGTRGGSTSRRLSIVLEKKGSVAVMPTAGLMTDGIENLPGVPEYSPTMKTKHSWTKGQPDSGSEVESGSEQDEADQPQASAAPREEDNITSISLPASTIGSNKIPPSSLERGKRAFKKAPSNRQLVMESESAGKKTRRKGGRMRAHIYEEHDSDMSTADNNLPNTTVHDLSTTVSVSRSSFNRSADGNIAGKRKKPRRLRLSPAEKEMLKMVVAVFINYALCNLPMTVMALAENGDRVPEEAFLVGMLLWAGNGAMNPIIYGFMNTRFKQGYRDIWNRFTWLFSR